MYCIVIRYFYLTYTLNCRNYGSLHCCNQNRLLICSKYFNTNNTAAALNLCWTPAQQHRLQTLSLGNSHTSRVATITQASSHTAPNIQRPAPALAPAALSPHHTARRR